MRTFVAAIASRFATTASCAFVDRPEENDMIRQTVFAGLATIALAVLAPGSSAEGRDGYYRGCDDCGRVVRVESLGRRGDNRLGGGTVLGAIVGGALGNQVGSGDGRKAATVAGALAGGAIGHDIERKRR